MRQTQSAWDVMVAEGCKAVESGEVREWQNLVLRHQLMVLVIPFVIYRKFTVQCYIKFPTL